MPGKEDESACLLDAYPEAQLTVFSGWSDANAMCCPMNVHLVAFRVRAVIVTRAPFAGSGNPWSAETRMEKNHRARYCRPNRLGCLSHPRKRESSDERDHHEGGVDDRGAELVRYHGARSSRVRLAGLLSRRTLTVVHDHAAQ